MTQSTSASQAEQPRTDPGDKNGDNGLTPLLIGQSTAVLAVAVAVVYGAGALSLGLKLWYSKDPWAAVLGQLPRDFLLIDAFSQVMLPVILIGVGAYLIYEKIEPDHTKPDHTKPDPAKTDPAKTDRSLLHPARILAWLSLAALLAAVPLVFLHFTTHGLIPGVIRPDWEIYVFCLALNMVSVGLAFFALLRVEYSESTWSRHRVIGMGIAALAFVPCVASASASFPLPKVVLCGPQFSHVDSMRRHYAIGNLIGISGQWVYVAETKTRSPQKPNEVIYSGNYIAVIPLSAVELESIGQDGECNDLQAPAAHSP